MNIENKGEVDYEPISTSIAFKISVLYSLEAIRTCCCYLPTKNQEGQGPTKLYQARAPAPAFDPLTLSSARALPIS